MKETITFNVSEEKSEPKTITFTVRTETKELRAPFTVRTETDPATK